MNSRELRAFAPFVGHVQSMRAGLKADFEICRCQLDAEQRYSRRAFDCPAPAQRCRTSTHVALRVMFLRLRLPEMHLNAEELERAVERLWQLTLELPRLDNEAVKARVVDAVQLERYEREKAART